MATIDETAVHDDLRSWARGSYPDEAAVELLVRAFGGRFARVGHPWVRVDDDSASLDPDALTDATTGVYSSGERRVLTLAAALMVPREIDLGDIVAGVDRDILDLILAALAHAGGSHQHSVLELDDGRPVSVTRGATLHAWPGDDDTLF